MNKIILLLPLIFLFSCNKVFNCSQFKQGHFLLKPNSTPKDYYFDVYRNDVEQIEIDPNGGETSMYINWISDCSYEVRSIPNRGNKFKTLNDSSVLRIEIHKIIKDTAFYKVYILSKEREIIARSGKMIRLDDSEVPEH